MEKNTYTLGEVIFGLRPEMQKMEHELSILKHFCQIDRERCKDLSFHLNLPYAAPKYHGIVCYAYNKTNWLENLKMKLFEEDAPIETAQVEKGEDGHYTFGLASTDPFPVSIKSNDMSQKRFDAQMDAILESDFRKNMVERFKVEEKNSKGKDKVCIEGDIDTFLLDFDCTITGQKNGILYTVRYLSHEDELRFIKHPNVTGENIKRMLESQIPKEVLNPYHIHLIDTSLIQGKGIVLQEFTPYSEVIFKIEETPKQLILKPCEKR